MDLTWIELWKTMLNTALAKIFPLTEESHLQRDEILGPWVSEATKAYRYPLNAGGKRLRGMLCLAMHECFTDVSSGDNSPLALECATSLELLHTYSLVHDDLPCMDDDSLRRGKPTSHVVYGDGKAVLIGDALLTKAFEVLQFGNVSSRIFETSFDLKLTSIFLPVSRAHLSQAVTVVLTKASGHESMILGQWMDVSLENYSKDAISSTKRDKLTAMRTLHGLKTGALLGASLQMGFLCGVFETLRGHWNKTPETLDLKIMELANKQHLLWKWVLDQESFFKEIGEKIGFAFQLQDDFLDITSSPEVLGKSIGKDVAHFKLSAIQFYEPREAEILVSELINDSMHQLHKFAEEWDSKLGILDNIPKIASCQSSWQKLDQLLLSMISRKS